MSRLAGRGRSSVGCETKKEAVTLALQRVVDDARTRRAQGLADLIAVADAGGFDFDRLEELDECST